jgi:hypothetical protein
LHINHLRCDFATGPRQLGKWDSFVRRLGRHNQMHGRLR